MCYGILAVMSLLAPVGCEYEHEILSVSSEGRLITLEDGSMWRIDSVEGIDTSRWLPATPIAICEGELLNVDTKESVSAERML